MKLFKSTQPTPNSGDRKTPTKNHSHRKTIRDIKSNKTTAPRLAAAKLKELNTILNPNLKHSDIDVDVNGIVGDDKDICLDDGEVSDLYEYEDEIPEKFKDEDAQSGDDDAEDDEDSDDDGRHARMLHNITGILPEAFECKKRKWNPVISEVNQESEFNPTHDVLSGGGQVTIEDLLGPSHGTSGNKIRKRMEFMEKKRVAIQVPLPKPERHRLDREAAYDHTNKDITKWEPLIKRNREASTLYFNNRNDVKPPTMGTRASEFTPPTEFEKTITSLMQDDEFMESCQNDGAKLLELKKVSVEDVKECLDRLAKMRSLIFHTETKAKHIKKIKSKSYHRLKKRDILKTASLDLQSDPEAAKEHAIKQQRDRVVSRMTIRHKNQGKWATRVTKRGLHKQDEGTQAAISEQLHLHNLLTRKQNSMDSSRSDDSSYKDNEDAVSSDEEGASKLVAKAREKTVKLMEQEHEVPHSGVSASPFMTNSSKDRGAPTFDDKAKNVAEPSLNNDVQEEMDDDSDSDSGGQMIDGKLSSGTKQAYELPSNEELIKRAFAGDDVVEEFEKAKEDVLNKKNPEPEKPLLLPGWGQWTGVRKRKGYPSCILKEHAGAKRKREASLKKRKDVHLKHVIISEKVDKKAEKLHSKTLPYPFTSKEVFECSIRMPIGPEFSPAATAGALVQPEVFKESDVIIDPIKFQQVDPHEREEQKQGGRKRKVKGKI